MRYAILSDWNTALVCMQRCKALMQLKASMKPCLEVLHTDVAAVEATRVDDSFTDLRTFQ